MSRAVVYLRFPLPRNGVQNPASVEWDQHKEHELWTLVRNNSRPDWAGIAAHFGVSVQYILQQASWLYEQELGSLKRKMSQINLKLPARAGAARSVKEKPSRGSLSVSGTPESDTGSAETGLALSAGGSDSRLRHGRKLLSMSTLALSDDESEDSNSNYSAFA